ncbi:MAG: hypothetical protein IPG84_14630 [Betaproteobacteria bacterium]|nr:hypothetical protein [Betaproteobacteria bacterium]
MQRPDGHDCAGRRGTRLPRLTIAASPSSPRSRQSLRIPAPGIFVQDNHGAKVSYRRPARIVQLRRSPRGKFAPRDVVHHPQRLEHRDRRRRERTARAVAHLDRDPDPAAPEPDRLDAFGADLGDPVAPPCPHQRQVEAAFPGHVVRVRRHRVADRPARGRVGLAVVRARDPRKSPRERGQRQCVVGRRATVDAGDEVFLADAGVARDRAADRGLQRMRRVEVALARPAGQDAMREHPGVLARAVVRQRRVRRRRRDLAQQIVDARRVRSAPEFVDAASGPPKQVGNGGLVLRLARVARAHDGDLLAGQPEARGAPGREERQRLEGLERTARERQVARGAGGRDERSARVDDRDRAAVDALLASPSFDVHDRDVRVRRRAPRHDHAATFSARSIASRTTAASSPRCLVIIVT